MGTTAITEPTPPTTERKNLAAFVVGIAGLGVGVGALMFELPALGLVAGICSLVAAVGSLQQPLTAPIELAQREPDAPVVSKAAFGAGEMDGSLMTADFFDVAVRNRVMAARRFLKPVAVVRLRIVGATGQGLAHDTKIADAIAATLRECDTACVLDDTDLALVLEDTPENGAVWVVERVRRALDDEIDATVWAGVACYPAHAMGTEELLEQAQDALERAREWPQDRIEVAYAD